MTTRFDPVLALSTLDKYKVRFVLIGGLAARVHGSPSVTNDLDICYDRKDDNLTRLAGALKVLGASLRGGPEGLPFLLDADTLKRGDHFTFLTDAGALDILGVPSGSHGFEELLLTAERMDLGGFKVWVAAIDDLISMKKSAGRPKDRVEVEILGALREEVDKSKPSKSRGVE
ncbi:MAG: hypothetical protein ABIS18_01680 [Actinomycetota bacterium]